MARSNTASSRKTASVKAPDATPAQNAAMIRTYIEEVFNGHHLDGLGKYWAQAMTSHWMGQETLRGLPAWREGMVSFLTAFPDAAYTLDDLFCAGDRGVWRGRWQATHGKGSRLPDAPRGGALSSSAASPRASWSRTGWSTTDSACTGSSARSRSSGNPAGTPDGHCTGTAGLARPPSSAGSRDSVLRKPVAEARSTQP
jgi:predicted ester cyclase